MAQLTNAQLVNNLKPYFATRRELQEVVLGGISGGIVTSLVGGTAITISGTAIVTVSHDTGDFGDLHTNYAEYDQQETISDIWTHTADLQIQGADLTFIGTQVIQTNASSSLSITPDQNLTLDPTNGNVTISPGGDVFFNPAGNDLLPVNNYDTNFGAINKKYLTIHAAELWVETLVAQDTIATIGGRVLVGPTTVLEVDFPGPDDPVLNQGFETLGGGGADVFANWTENYSGTDLIQALAGHSGSYGCFITIVDSGGNTYVSQTFDTLENQDRSLAFWTRGSGSLPGYYAVYDVSNAGYIVSKTSTGVSGSSYTLVAPNYTTPSGCVSVRLEFWGPSTNGHGAGFDDVTDVGNADTQMKVRHNQMSIGDYVYMEANGKVEFMIVASNPSGSGPYTYDVIRNLDGSGSNDWYAGDAVFNTGKLGNGFIDLYSIAGVYAGSTAGPTIVGNVRYTGEGDILDDPGLGSNGGFEIAGIGGADVFYAWTEIAGSGTITDETSIVNSGSDACKLTYVTGESQVYHDMNVTAGNDYYFFFYTRGDGSVAGQYLIYDYSNLAAIISKGTTGVSGTTYSRVYGSFTAPGGCSVARIYFYSPSSSGSAYFDDVVAFGDSGFNNWTEHWAIGNLNGLYSVGTDTYGVGLGRPDKSYVLIDDTDGVTIRDSSANKLIQLDISGNATFGHVTDNYANVYWNAGTQQLQFRGGTNGTDVQALIDTDGSILAGTTTVATGVVKLDEVGITLDMGTSFTGDRSLRFTATPFGTLFGKVYGYYSSNGTTEYGIQMESSDAVVFVGEDVAYGGLALIHGSDNVRITSDSGSTINIDAGTGNVTLTAGRTRVSSALNVGTGLFVGDTTTTPTNDEVRVATHARLGGGLYVGSTTGSVATGRIQASADIIANDGLAFGNSGFSPGTSQLMYHTTYDTNAGLRPWDSSTYYHAYAYVPLTTKLTILNNVSRSGTSTETIVCSGVPGGAKAIAIRLTMLSTSAGSWYFVGPSTGQRDHLGVRCQVASGYIENNGVVGSPTSNQIYATYAVSGTTNMWLYVVGYYI